MRVMTMRPDVLQRARRSARSASTPSFIYPLCCKSLKYPQRAGVFGKTPIAKQGIPRGSGVGPLLIYENTDRRSAHANWLSAHDKDFRRPRYQIASAEHAHRAVLVRRAHGL